MGVRHEQTRREVPLGAVQDGGEGVTEREKLERVIKGLELCGYHEGMPQCASCPYNGKQCWKRLKTDALALLKAQEPVKPEMIMYTGAGISISNCPRCGCKIDEYHNDKFCGSCGKAVKWE